MQGADLLWHAEDGQATDDHPSEDGCDAPQPKRLLGSSRDDDGDVRCDAHHPPRLLSPSPPEARRKA